MGSNRTGVGEYTYKLLDAVFAIDKSNQYFLFYNSDKDVSKNIPKWHQENVHYVYTRWPNKLLNLLLFLKLVQLDKLVYKKYSSILNLKSKINIWFSPNLNFTNLSKSIKHIQTIHDLSFEFLPECFTKKQLLWHKMLWPKKQCQKADIIIVPSENTKRDVVERFKIEDFLPAGEAGRFKILSPGVFTKISGETNKKQKYILFLGTLEPRKNVEVIIKAFARSELRTVGYELLIAGDTGWKSDKVLELINQTSGVKYLGFVDEKEKINLFQNASLFVFPSLYEGFGIPVLEAMANGVPVVVSNRSSLPEVVQNAGILVNPNNVEELANAIKLVLHSDNLRNIMIKKGQEVAKQFDWQKSAEIFLSILEYENRN